MKARVAKLRRNPLDNLVEPPPSNFERCIIITFSIEEERISVVDFLQNAGFEVRNASKDEIAIFPQQLKDNN